VLLISPKVDVVGSVLHSLPDARVLSRLAAVIRYPRRALLQASSHSTTKPSFTADNALGVHHDNRRA
jgi:hypothetical protein